MFGFNLASKREKAYSDGDWDQVIAVALKQLQSDARDVKALNDLAEAYHKKKMFKEALKVCQDIDRYHPVTDLVRQSVNLGIRYMRYHLVHGEALAASGEYDEALKILTRLKFLKGHFSDKFHVSAQIFISKGEPDKAVSEYEKMWELRPDRGDKIIKGLQALLAKFPSNKKAHSLQLAIYQKQGHLKRILDEGEQAVRQGTVDPVIVYRLAYYHQSEGRSDRAIQLFLDHRARRPDDQEVTWLLCFLYGETGQIEQALEEYRQLSEQSPDLRPLVLSKLENLARHGETRQKLPVLFELISVHLRAGSPAAARQWLDMVAPLARTDAAIMDKVAGLLNARLDGCLESGDMDMAKMVLDQMLRLDPSNQATRDRQQELGSILSQKRVQDLESMLQNGGLSETERQHILKQLGELYLAQGEPEEKIISVYQPLAQTPSPFQSEALKRLGLTFMRKGLLDLAENQFGKLLQLSLPDGQRKDYCYEIGLAYEGTGAPDKAREYFKRTLEIDVGYKDVAQRLERLPKESPVATQTMARPSNPMEVVEERYEQIVKIGGGGMGAVFRALDRVLRRPVALKFIKGEYQTDPEAVARFVREAQSASHLKHPGIVAIYDIHVKEPIYIAMEYVEGGTLRDAVKRGATDAAQVKAIAIQLCDALGYAHRQGVVHRDIKPDNILISKTGELKIADFGLARLAESGTEMTRAGQILGTPLYMAPEQILGKPVDRRTDIYALGIMLYELLTGKAPFTEGDVAYRQIHESPMTPGLVNPAIPASIETAVMNCLQKKPEDRYDTAETLADALRNQG